MKDEFTTFDIINKLGIPRGRLREWMNEGFIVPSIQKAEGVGTKALFDRVDIYAIVLFKQLIEEHKISRSEAGLIVKEWSGVLHKYKSLFTINEFAAFFASYGNCRILRRNNKLIVAPLVLADLLDTGMLPREKLKKSFAAFGDDLMIETLNTKDLLDRILKRDLSRARMETYVTRHPTISKILRTDQHLKKLAPYEEWDSILLISFHKIREEAVRVFE